MNITCNFSKTISLSVIAAFCVRMILLSFSYDQENIRKLYCVFIHSLSTFSDNIANIDFEFKVMLFYLLSKHGKKSIGKDKNNIQQRKVSYFICLSQLCELLVTPALVQCCCNVILSTRISF